MKTLEGIATLLFSEDGMRIELEDFDSGVTVRATVDAKQTLSALSRCASVKCEIDWPSDLRFVGMVCERKQALLEKTWEGYRPSNEVVQQACVDQGLFVDGFELWDDGLGSQQPVGKHRVVLERFVTKGEKSEKI